MYSLKLLTPHHCMIDWPSANSSSVLKKRLNSLSHGLAVSAGVEDGPGLGIVSSSSLEFNSRNSVLSFPPPDGRLFFGAAGAVELP